MTSVDFEVRGATTLLKIKPGENQSTGSDGSSFYNLTVGLFQLFFKVTRLPEINNNNQTH